MKKLILSIIIGSSLVVSILQTAQARPKYNKVMMILYGHIYDNEGNRASCTACHTDNNKKKNNDFSTALKKELNNRKNVKDEEKIKRAIERIVDKRNSKGETYKDLLRNKKIPE